MADKKSHSALMNAIEKSGFDYLSARTILKEALKQTKLEQKNEYEADEIGLLLKMFETQMDGPRFNGLALQFSAADEAPSIDEKVEKVEEQVAPPPPIEQAPEAQDGEEIGAGGDSGDEENDQSDDGEDDNADDGGNESGKKSKSGKKGKKKGK